MKILQIGLGYWGKNHLRVWNQLGHDIHIAELDPKQHTLCSAYNMDPSKITTNFKEFLSKVEGVDIVVPTHLHHKIAKECLEAGKDVFIEKPITASLEKAQDLLETAEKNGRFIQVGHLQRYSPATKFIKEQIESGKLGPIRYMAGKYMEFKNRVHTDIGVTHTEAIHIIDLFNYFMGKLPKSVTAITRDHFNRGMEDLTIVMMDYDPGLAQVESGYFRPGKHRDITIVGEKATITANVVSQEVEVHHKRHELIDNKWQGIDEGSTIPKIPFKEPLTEELTHFVDCIQSRKTPLVDGREGYNVLRVIDTALRSSKEKKAIYL